MCVCVSYNSHDLRLSALSTQHCEVVNTPSSVPVCSLWCVHAVIDPCFCRTAGVYTAMQYIAEVLLDYPG